MCLRPHTPYGGGGVARCPGSGPNLGASQQEDPYADALLLKPGGIWIKHGIPGACWLSQVMKGAQAALGLHAQRFHGDHGALDGCCAFYRAAPSGDISRFILQTKTFMHLGFTGPPADGPQLTFP